MARGVGMGIRESPLEDALMQVLFDLDRGFGPSARLFHVGSAWGRRDFYYAQGALSQEALVELWAIHLAAVQAAERFTWIAASRLGRWAPPRRACYRGSTVGGTPPTMGKRGVLHG